MTGEDLEIARIGQVLDGLVSPTASTVELAAAIRDLTPARILVGAAGSSYPTDVLLQLRADHSAARDAATSALDVDGTSLADLVMEYDLFPVRSHATSRDEYLRRPDLGRRLSETARIAVSASCDLRPDLQIIIGDGLSPTAVAAQAATVFRDLMNGARDRRWRVGRPFVVEHCRVGVLNDVGDLLAPRLAILLIGERPGMSTARSMSAYLALHPASGHTDADRRLVSNIHEGGLDPGHAAEQVLAVADDWLASSSAMPSLNHHSSEGITKGIAS